MQVRLVRYSFPDRPDWVILDEKVPLGTRYEVIGYDSEMALVNKFSHEMREVEAFLLTGNGDTGWLPTICFEVIREES